MEQQADEFYEQVRDGYLEFAKWQKDRVIVIEGWKSTEEIADEIWKILNERFPDLKSAISAQQPAT